jgi:two-component system response regulator MprA
MDDESDFCDFVEIVARGLDYKVTKIVDSRRFKEAYLRCRPDVIVLDMVMPEPDGPDLIRWLIAEGSEAKVLIVTGYNPQTAKSAHLQSAARGHLRVKTFTKPVSVSKLRAALS